MISATETVRDQILCRSLLLKNDVLVSLAKLFAVQYLLVSVKALRTERRLSFGCIHLYRGKYSVCRTHGIHQRGQITVDIRDVDLWREREGMLLMFRVDEEWQRRQTFW